MMPPDLHRTSSVSPADLPAQGSTSGYRRTRACRISGSRTLLPVIDLGIQAQAGVFPAGTATEVPRAPLELVWCPDSALVQLAHTSDAAAMFGDNYGYRSSLNQSMVAHLSHKVTFLERLTSLAAGDVVVDIGSNDATTLKAYRTPGLQRIGIDPTGHKFRAFYDADLQLVPDFFSVDAFRAARPRRGARIVTSIAMFYDLDEPVEFARQVESILADDGLWHLEQSYLPAMMRALSYDTVCHEHLTYYSLHTIKSIMDAAGLRIVDVTQNDVNGGSFAVTVARRSNRTVPVNEAVVRWMLEHEQRMGLHTAEPYLAFAARVLQHRETLQSLVRALVGDGRTVLGYGASTKGNVLLQYCGFSSREIRAIAEVNSDKFGCVTPGTHIPIVSEEQAHAMRPDYYLVLPWHFKEGILRREEQFRSRGGRFIFPFPEVHIV